MPPAGNGGLERSKPRQAGGWVEVPLPGARARLVMRMESTELPAPHPACSPPELYPVVCNGLPLWHGAQLTVDATLRWPCDT